MVTKLEGVVGLGPAVGEKWAEEALECKVTTQLTTRRGTVTQCKEVHVLASRAWVYRQLKAGAGGCDLWPVVAYKVVLGGKYTLARFLDCPASEPGLVWVYLSSMATFIQTK